MKHFNFIASDRQAEAIASYAERMGVAQSVAIRKALDFWPPLWVSGNVKGLYAVIETCSGSVQFGGVG